MLANVFSFYLYKGLIKVITMRKVTWFFGMFVVLQLQAQQPKRLIDLVDPFIGTGGHGHTYPGATVPFGMVQLSPDNGTQGWDWSSGYHYGDSLLAGFSHTHLSGTGVGDLCDISIMPSTLLMNDTAAYRTAFSHSKEVAQPGYYGVYLSKEMVWAELTTTPHCGMHKYTFPKTNNAKIKLDLGFAINMDKPAQCHLKKINDSLFVGYRMSTGWAKNQYVAFAIQLSKKPKKKFVYENKNLYDADDVTAQKVDAVWQFDTKEGEQILVKVGLSYKDTDGALASLQEIPVWNFDLVKKAAQNYWEKELRAILVKSADLNFLKTFYTALYHTYLAPVTFTDVNYDYTINGKLLANSKGATRYTIHSLWDTFRAANPLLTITQPGRVPDIINSYLNFYEVEGLLPVWDLHYNETNCMTGYHAIPVIADAILKNMPNIDYYKAYDAMVVTSIQKQRGTPDYIKYGYLPQDKHSTSATITLEYAYDDWCIAQVAKRLGKQADYETYMKRAQFYKNIFDKQTGFFRAKNSNGKFAEPFDPMRSETDSTAHYTEGTAWQHSFFVLHDVEGFANLHGGRGKLTQKLDSLFTVSSNITGNHVPPDVSGLIGQYAHGNEPSHHIAYMYSCLGEPWKAAEKVREICSTMYNTTPEGLVGNEDCGQMSAWYIFTALGFYPYNPATGDYVFGSPLINGAQITLPNGKVFAIDVMNNSNVNKYIDKVILNGEEYPYTYLKHADIMHGGNLKIIMSNKPNKKWGVHPKAAIPSMEIK
jgi:predicted alpha-1,2-mannosidase